jgi:hypothetical protein
MRDPQFPFEQAQLRINPNLLLATHDYPERRRRHSMKNSWQGGTSNNRPLLILPFHKPEKNEGLLLESSTHNNSRCFCYAQFPPESSGGCPRSSTS